MAFSFDQWLLVQQARVETLLAARIKAIDARTPRPLGEAMAYSLMAGGKRLRPVLVLAFSDAVSQASDGGGVPAQDAAAAVEMIHTYSLIHDDLPALDDDDLRRGRPTNHKQFGEAIAILAGDALLTEAFTVLGGGVAGPPGASGDASTPAEQAVRGRLSVTLALAAGAGGMVGGQMLDIATDRPAQLDYLSRLHRLKTGALLKASCMLGAIAGGGSVAQVQAAERYGESLGLAFQIQDDVLDVTATAEELGKPTGADSAAGRHTFPAVVGLEQAKKLAQAEADQAIAAVKLIEPEPGPLAALAQYSVSRTH